MYIFIFSTWKSAFYRSIEIIIRPCTEYIVQCTLCLFIKLLYLFASCIPTCPCEHSGGNYTSTSVVITSHPSLYIYGIAESYIYCNTYPNKLLYRNYSPSYIVKKIFFFFFNFRFCEDMCEIHKSAPGPLMNSLKQFRKIFVFVKICAKFTNQHCYREFRT